MVSLIKFDPYLLLTPERPHSYCKIKELIVIYQPVRRSTNYYRINLGLFEFFFDIVCMKAMLKQKFGKVFLINNFGFARRDFFFIIFIFTTMGPPPLSFPKTPKTNTNQIFVTKSVVYTKNTMTCTKTTQYTDGAIFFFYLP